MVALMVGTAVLRLSNCVTNDVISMDDDDNSSSTDVGNDSVTNTDDVITCENEPVDIAVTLALLVGTIMVSAAVFRISCACIHQLFDMAGESLRVVTR